MTEQIEQQDGRFSISVDGEQAGFAQFVDDDGRRVFFHTEVDKAFSGQGLAGKLVAQALDETRRAGLRVVPVCSYVEKFTKENSEYADLVDPVDDSAKAAAKAASD